MVDVLGIVDKHLKAPLDYSFSKSNGQYHCYQLLVNFKGLPKRLKIRNTSDKEINEKTDQVIEGFDETQTRVYFAPFIPTGISNLFYAGNDYDPLGNDFILFYFNHNQSIMHVFFFEKFTPAEQYKDQFIKDFFLLIKDQC